MKEPRLPANPVPPILMGRAGSFYVWWHGPNDYVVTNGPEGDVIARRDMYGLAYLAALNAERVTTAPKRETITCPVCKGAGEIAYNDSNPHGYGPDPQQDRADVCHECGGRGEVRA